MTGEQEALTVRRARHQREILDLLHEAKAAARREQSEVMTALIGALQESLDEALLFEEELTAQGDEVEAANARLIAERQHYRRLFEEAPFGYAVTDLQGVLLDVNWVAGQLLGRQPRRLVGKPLAVYVSEKNRQEFRRWVNHLPDREDVEVGLLALAPLGRAPVAVSVAVSVRRDLHANPDSAHWMFVPLASEQPVPRREPTTARRGAGTVDASEPEGATAQAVPFPPERPRPFPRLLERRLAYRLGVVHADTMYAHGLRSMVAEKISGGVEVVSAMPNRTAIDRMLAQARPDVLLVDVVEAALPLLRWLREHHADLVIVALADADDDAQMAALAAGADGVLQRTSDPADVLYPLLAAERGWITLPRRLVASMLDSELRARELPKHLDPESIRLLRRIIEGASSQGLGEELHLSVRTVKRRVADLYHSLGVSSRVQAAAVAGRMGLVDPYGPTDDPRDRQRRRTVADKTAP